MTTADSPTVQRDVPITPPQPALQCPSWCHRRHDDLSDARHGVGAPLGTATYLDHLAVRGGPTSTAHVTVEYYDDPELHQWLSAPHVLLELLTDEWGRVYVDPDEAVRLGKALIDAGVFALEQAAS